MISFNQSSLPDTVTWLRVRRIGGLGRLRAMSRDVFRPSLLLPPDSLPSSSPSLRIAESCSSSVGPRLTVRSGSEWPSLSVESGWNWASVEPQTSHVSALKGKLTGRVAWERPLNEPRGVPEDSEEVDEWDSDPREDEQMVPLPANRGQRLVRLEISTLLLCER